MRRARTLAWVVPALAISACLPRPRPQPETQFYDFGPQPTTTSAASVGTPLITSAIVVRPPDAPLWLDSPALFYRLAYDEPARIRTYAYSRWVASPIRLLGDLLRRRVAESSATVVAGDDEAAAGEYLLQLQVEEFSQVLDSPTESRAVIRARAALVEHATRQVAAQHAFSIDRKAPSANGAGAVAGLADASRQLSDEVVVWVAEMLPKLAPGPAEPAPPPATTGN